MMAVTNLTAIFEFKMINVLRGFCFGAAEQTSLIVVKL
jgi:hypothetical protein